MCSLRNSFVVSADMAHGLHPNYPAKHDRQSHFLFDSKHIYYDMRLLRNKSSSSIMLRCKSMRQLLRIYNFITKCFKIRISILRISTVNCIVVPIEQHDGPSHQPGLGDKAQRQPALRHQRGVSVAVSPSGQAGGNPHAGVFCEVRFFFKM